MSGPPNSWPQRPFKQWPAPCYSHQQCLHHLYEHVHVSHPPQPSTHPQPYPVAPPSYLVSPISCAHMYPAYNHVPPRFMCGHQTPSPYVFGQPFQYAEPRRASRMKPLVHSCASLLGVELVEPFEPLPNGIHLSVRLGRQEAPHHLLHQDLLDMFQYLYGRMLKSIERIADHWLRDKVSCRGAVRRFEERKGWQPCDSRLLLDGENFFCAPYIVVTFAKLPHRTTITELVELIRTHCLPHEDHMQPAFKFKDGKNSMKFEPGAVYLTVDAKHFTARPVVKSPDHHRHHQGRQRGNRHRVKEIEYYHEDNDGGHEDMTVGSRPRELRSIRKYARNSSKRCREVVRRLSAKHFGFDSMVWVEIENLEFRFNNWYPLGSADANFGLTVTSRELVKYDASRAARSSMGRPDPSREFRPDRELHDIAPTLRIIFPVDHVPPAESNEDSDGPMVRFVKELRRELSAVSTQYGQFAILVFWGDDNNAADWFSPEVVYKPTGDGEKYMASTEGCGI